ncbi:hypothetical protein DXN17_24110 [Salmonella enterica subsp. enterica serovar Enteritidis]|nr:hypothetical protein DXN17_24110 [Salmonella enterica subsp. enterica serovar Enteritidis]
MVFAPKYRRQAVNRPVLVPYIF